jgi:hypothetical protein
VNIIFICSLRDAMLVPPLLYELLTVAAGDSDLEALEVTGVMSSDADQGFRGIQAMASYVHIDSIICFGKTSASLGMPDLPPLITEYVRLPDRLSLTNIVRLPSPHDEWWLPPDNSSSAVEAIKPMFVRAPITAPSPHIAWPSNVWN